MTIILWWIIALVHGNMDYLKAVLNECSMNWIIVTKSYHDNTSYTGTLPCLRERHFMWHMLNRNRWSFSATLGPCIKGIMSSAYKSCDLDVVITWEKMTRSYHNFPHTTTTDLSWHDQISEYIRKKQNKGDGFLERSWNHFTYGFLERPWNHFTL